MYWVVLYMQVEREGKGRLVVIPVLLLMNGLTWNKTTGLPVTAQGGEINGWCVVGGAHMKEG